MPLPAKSRQYVWPAVLMAVVIVSQSHQAAQARVQRAMILREANEIKALVWLAVEQSGRR